MRGRLVALLAAGSLALVACGSSSDSTGQPLGDAGGPVASTSSAAPAVSGAASATPDASAAVLTGYAAYWTALLAAHAAGNAADPDLAAHATGTALSDAQSGIVSNSARGVRMKGTVKHQPKVTALSGGTATVTDCVDLRSWYAYDVPSGRRDPSIRPFGRVTGTYELTRSAGSWVVSTAEQGEFC